MRSLAIVVAVFAAHYLPTPLAALMASPDRAVRWLEYIFSAAEAAIVLALLLPTFSPQGFGLLGVIACSIGVMQESMKAVCGIAAFGDDSTPLWSGLCSHSAGPLPYAITAATALIYLRIAHGQPRR